MARPQHRTRPRFVWVNTYRTTQEYGGPEEGGWWYTDYRLLFARRVPFHAGSKARARQQRKFERRYGQRDPFSIYGGYGIATLVQRGRGQSETTSRPTYC